jgi:group I intron endonuclease
MIVHMLGTVYVIENLENGKGYIGQTTRTIEQRFNEHCKSFSGCHAVRNAIQKYGPECFSIELIWEGECSQEELDALEIHYISQFNTICPHGYNLTYGGMGGKFSDEKRKNLSEACIKKYQERPELRIVDKNKYTDEMRKKMSEACIKKYQERPELKDVGKQNKGSKRTPEQIEKMKEAWEIRKNQPQFKENMSKSMEKYFKRVYCFDKQGELIKAFDSLSEISKEPGFSKGGISSAIRTRSFYKNMFHVSYQENFHL